MLCGVTLVNCHIKNVVISYSISVINLVIRTGFFVNKEFL